MQKDKIKRKDAAETNIRAYIKRCIVHILIFCIVTLICTTVIAFSFYNLDDPSSFSRLCAEISLYVSFTICTCMLLKGITDKRIIWGFIYGAVLLFFLYAISLMLGNGFGSVYKTVLRFAMPIWGAFIGVLFKKARTKSARKRKRRT